MVILACSLRLNKKTHDKEYTDSRKNNLCRGKYLKVIVGTQMNLDAVVGTYRTNALAEGGRQRVDDIHGWLKTLSESLIAALRLTEFVGFPLKYGENSLRRITAFYLLCEWVGGKIFSGLLLILFESLFEDWLETWCGRRCLDVRGHLAQGDSELDRSNI